MNSLMNAHRTSPVTVVRKAAARDAVPSRPVRVLLATLTLAVLFGMAETAFAQGMGGPDGMRGMQGMHGMHGGQNRHAMGGEHGGPGGLGGMMGGAHVSRMMDAVSATPEQRTQIKAIMDIARNDLKAQRESGRTLNQQMQAAFAQPTVDARVVESLRALIQMQRDVASKRMTQALLEASRVLTVEQRKTLADVMAKRQAMMQRHTAERAALEKAAK